MAIAESLALSGLRVIASPVMKKLVEKGFSYVGMDVPSELKDLVNTVLPQLAIAKRASEGTHINIPELKAWLQSLKDTYDEAEDILDEVEYQKIAKKIKHENWQFMVRITSSPLIKPLAQYTDKKRDKFSFLSSNKRKLWVRLNKLKNNVKGLIEVAKVLYAVVPTQPNEIPVAETSSMPQSTIFIGRDGEHKLIVDELLKEPVSTEKKPYSVVAIVGIGGAGKTTLAQHIYCDHDVANNFDMKMWISLTRNMDVLTHTKAMIESASSGKECPQSSTLDALQSKLLGMLSQSKRALVVLDDLWYTKSEEEHLQCKRNEDDDWERLLAPFNLTNGSNVILLTSRSKKLPLVLESEITFFYLGELMIDDSMALFRHHAGFDKMDESPLKNELEEISVQIVQKLSRLPLAIKSVASQLRGRWEVSKWREILEGSNLSELKVALMWSYQQLDKALQQCFLFCSILPKGFKFAKASLIPIWLALNYIWCSDNKDADHIGSLYFDELVSRFFIQAVDHSEFIIHDAFRDLAESLTREECFSIVDEQVVEIPSTVHHLYMAVRDIKEHVSSICKLERLRTLIILYPLEEDSKENLDRILMKLKKLRILVLDLSPSITRLPEKVCELKYLKYLGFNYSSITQVPESLSSLHLLCVLFLPFGMPALPKSMSNLRNLRRVYVTGEEKDEGCSGLPPWRDVGKNTSLERLPEFHVRKEKGYELQQLGNLSQLKGDIIISGLENVSHKDEAAQAKLKDKNLDDLRLEWSYDSNRRNSDFETLQLLQPPKNLKDLSIIGYSADRYPTWLGDESIRHVRFLLLQRCNFLEVLPSNLHMLKYCEKIILQELLNLKELPTFPVCLEELSILRCPSLVLITEQELVTSNQEVQINHPLLLEKEFVLSKMSSILEQSGKGISDNIFGKYQKMVCDEREMFQQIGKLTGRDLTKDLEVLDCAQNNILLPCEDQLQAWWNCHQERVEFIYTRVPEARQFDLPSLLTDLTLAFCNITDKALSDCLRNLSSLQHLKLEGIMSLFTLPLEDTMSQLSRLKSLKIISCWLLRSLGSLHKLYLDKFNVSDCPCLEFVNEEHGSHLPLSLQCCELHQCTISSGIFCGEFPKLNYVCLNTCRSSESLSIDKLTSVTSLLLVDCPDICYLRGLDLLCNLKKLRLTLLPKLTVKDYFHSWPGCTESLYTDNLEILKMFSSENSVQPRNLFIEYLQEEIFMSENLSLLDSLEGLYFGYCKIKSIATNFTNLSNLQWISFEFCPNISQLPKLPKSITAITIKGCSALKERCQHNGEDWSEITDINFKDIE